MVDSMLADDKPDVFPAHTYYFQHADLYMMDPGATREVLMFLFSAMLTVMFNL